jgi:hypothetical protein
MPDDTNKNENVVDLSTPEGRAAATDAESPSTVS